VQFKRGLCHVKMIEREGRWAPASLATPLLGQTTGRQNTTDQTTRQVQTEGRQPARTKSL